MNKFDKFFSTYIIVALPFIIGLIVWETSVGPEAIRDAISNTNSDSIMLKVLHSTLGWLLMSWIPISLFITLKMVIVRKFRETLLLKISGITERDERESIISGEAAKFSFLSTSALLLLFLFLSIFTISIGKYPESAQVTGQHGYITINTNFTTLNSDTVHKEIKQDGLILFNYQGFPLSNSLLILIILLWQFGSYRYLIHKQL